MAYSCGIARGTYTNHSLRATAITNLKRCKWLDKQIMSVSSHKSAASLTTYQKVNSEEKLKMGNTLSKFLTSDYANPDYVRESVDAEYNNMKILTKQQVSKRKLNTAPTCTVSRPSFVNPTTGQEIPEEPIPKRPMLVSIPDNQDKAIAPHEAHFDLSDCDIMKLVADCERENEHLLMSQQVTTSNTTTTRQLVSKKTSPRIPVFNNCQISGNVTININKM